MKEPSVYLAHILEAAERIAEYTKQGESAFSTETIVQDAVIRNLEVIGEAAKRVPDTMRSAYPLIPWKRLAGLRDILIHQYDGVDLGQVWRIAESVLPQIRTQIQGISDGVASENDEP